MNPTTTEVAQAVQHHRLRRMDRGVDWNDLWDEAAILIIGYERLLLRPYPGGRPREAVKDAVPANEADTKHAG